MFSRTRSRRRFGTLYEVIHAQNCVVHPARLDVEVLLADCHMRRVRRSGPGGQRRNKVETGVRLKHGPSGVEAEGSERRSSAENLKLATRRLRLLLAVQVRTEMAPAPSALWKSRCRGGRVSISSEHVEFPALLSEAMDVLESHEWDPRAAGEWLGCTPSQLVKLLKRSVPAGEHLNRQRRERGLGRLR